MKHHLIFRTLLSISSLVFAACSAEPRGPSAQARIPKPDAKFVNVNGVRLQYLDWGGSGAALIFIHGLGDSPHAFDDIARAFRDRFRTIAYARRGHGRSQAKGPYDHATLTEACASCSIVWRSSASCWWVGRWAATN
jgi:hypothetical protein